MLWFRYRWILTFSHGLCVKIIRGSDAVKLLSEEVDFLFSRPMNLVVGKGISKRLLRLIDILDDAIFSASVLLYREEKDLIKFSERVEDSAQRLINKVKKERGVYERDLRKLEGMMEELKKKKQKLPKKLQRNVQMEKGIVIEDEERKKEVISLLHEVTSFIEEMDGKIHDIHLGAKAQRRGTFNIYKLKENIIIRSNFRLGELTGRKGVEAGALIKKIRKKLHHFSRIVGRSRKLDHSQVSELLKYCRMEADDLKRVFLFVIQLSERVGERLNRLGVIISKDSKLKLLIEEYSIARKRLNILRKDIETQYKRLDNEFKRGGFVPHPQIQREIRMAT